MNPDKKLSVLIVDDEENTAQSLKELLTSLEHTVMKANNGENALKVLSRESADLVITDLMMPGMDGFALVKKVKELHPNLLVFIFTGHDSFSMARKALSLGADDFLLKPVDKDQLNIALNQAQEKIRLKSKIAHLGKLVESKYSPSNIIGDSEPMQRVFRLIEKAQSTQANVLIQGESGTGKELVARAIFSPQASRKSNFVSVNCCAISEGLIESELFGHVRGAFSGAISDREGLFELADNGTIFLDEIGDLPPNIQMKLLRVIQEREVRRVGENRVRQVNVRILASTNKNLEHAVKMGGFREDLYYRLNVIPIILPRLRERLGDVPILANHFLSKHNPSTIKKEFSPEALQLLQSYHYPGNVRELENITQRAISLSIKSVITKEDVASFLPSHYPKVTTLVSEKFDGLSYHEMKKSAEELEREYLLHHLRESGGNVVKAANAAQLNRTAFHNKIKKFNISLDELRKE
jgi:DNA-binding NtrC family response regulator